MHRVDTDGHVGNMFDEGDPGVPRAPTQVDADILNAFQEELANAVTSAGVALVKGTNNQLATAMVNTLVAQTITGVKTFINQMVIDTTMNVALSVESTHASGVGVSVIQNNAGTAIQGFNTGSGVAAEFEAANTTGSAVSILGTAAGDTLSVSNTGNATAGVFSSAPTGADGVIESSSAGAGPAVSALNSSTGPAISATATSGNGLTASSGSGYGAVLVGNATKAPLQITPLGSAPSSPVNGDIYYDSGTSTFYGRAGGAWVALH